MRRFATTAISVVLALAVLGVTGCQSKVEVKTGTRTICTYGEVISDTTHVIKVPARDAGKYRVVTVTKTCDRHLKLEALYSSAQSDIASGDLVAAQKKLADVVAIDPTFRKAKTQLDQIVAKKRPSPDTATPISAVTPGTTPSTETTPGATDPVGPVASLLVWTPDSVPGFTPAGKAGADALTITREYLPSASSGVVTCVIVAEQFRDAEAAKAGLQSQVKQHYSAQSETVQVNSHTAYFGTDGRRFAVLGFTQGPVMVAIEMSGKQGQQAALKANLTELAKVLP